MDCSKPIFPDSSLNIVRPHVPNPSAAPDISILHLPSLAPSCPFPQAGLLAWNARPCRPCLNNASVNFTASLRFQGPPPKWPAPHLFVSLQSVLDFFKNVYNNSHGVSISHQYLFSPEQADQILLGFRFFKMIKATYFCLIYFFP